VLVGEQSIPIEAVPMLSGNQDIHLVPCVEGYSNGGWQMIAGAVLIVAAVVISVYASPAAGTPLYKAGSCMMSTGIAMAISGVAQLLTPSPRTQSPSERPENKPSELFDGPVNTINQSHPIQICYGEVEIGSAVLSTLIDNSNWQYGSGYGGRGSIARYPQHPTETDYDERDDRYFVL